MKFTAEDFYSIAPTALGIMPHEAVKIANAKLAEWREQWVKDDGQIDTYEDMKEECDAYRSELEYIANNSRDGHSSKLANEVLVRFREKLHCDQVDERGPT